MQLVVQSGSEPGRTYDITASQKIRMGRQSGNDVVVPDEQVSRRHAEIEERNGGLVVTDLGSSNGTFVNGTRITSAQNLQSGDTVQVGTTVLKVVGSAPASGAEDYDQNATQVGGFTPSAADYGYTPPAAPSAPANDYGQSGGYGQPSSGYGQSPSGYDQPGQGAGGYGGAPSYGGSGAGSSYDQGQGAGGYGGFSPAAGSSYGGSSSPSYDAGQSAYGGSGQGAGGYGGSSSPAAGSSYDQGQGAGGYGGFLLRQAEVPTGAGQVRLTTSPVRARAVTARVRRMPTGRAREVTTLPVRAQVVMAAAVTTRLIRARVVTPHRRVRLALMTRTLTGSRVTTRARRLTAASKPTGNPASTGSRALMPHRPRQLPPLKRAVYHCL